MHLLAPRQAVCVVSRQLSRLSTRPLARSMHCTSDAGEGGSTAAAGQGADTTQLLYPHGLHSLSPGVSRQLAGVTVRYNGGAPDTAEFVNVLSSSAVTLLNGLFVVVLCSHTQTTNSLHC